MRFFPRFDGRRKIGALKKNALLFLLPHLDPEVGLSDDVLLFRVELGSLLIN